MFPRGNTRLSGGERWVAPLKSAPTLLTMAVDKRQFRRRRRILKPFPQVPQDTHHYRYGSRIANRVDHPVQCRIQSNHTGHNPLGNRSSVPRQDRRRWSLFVKPCRNTIASADPSISHSRRYPLQLECRVCNPAPRAFPPWKGSERLLRPWPLLGHQSMRTRTRLRSERPCWPWLGRHRRRYDRRTPRGF